MITVYVGKDCPYCKKVIAYLDRQKVDYQVKNTIRDEFKEELFDKGIKSVPAIVYSGEEEKVVVGFDRKAIDEIIEEVR